jgi:MFS family permease
MTRAEALNLNPSLLFWARFFTMFKMLNAVVTLSYLHRGLSIEQTVWLSGIFGATMLLFEVPSGYLADRIGRK